VHMRALLVVLTLLFASLLLMAGCGGEQGSAPEKEEPSPAPAETTQGTAASSSPEESATLAIISSDGERAEVEVEIADERDEQQRGLMERTELAEDAGMLFVFERDEPRSFWMRNTLIPLSIAYIADGGRIVDIQDMQPLDETSHPSTEPARYALEVNQGFFAERGIQIGDEVEIPNL
jgi:uncharacterized membrane protein (UPF0127 family)